MAPRQTSLVRVKEPTALHDPVDDIDRVLNPDQLYVADDPVVDAYPNCFEPVQLHRDIVAAQRPVVVETATAAPGETRDVEIPAE